MDAVDQDLAENETFWTRIFDAPRQPPIGKKTDFPVKHEFAAWEYTRHNDGGGFSGGRTTDKAEMLPPGVVRVQQRAMFPKGLSTTRFHQGFQRRKQSHIRQDESRLRGEMLKQHLSLRHLERRRQRLGKLDKRNGFNLITGQFDANCRCTTPFHVQPRTRETGYLSDVAERAEYLLLRDSKYKFHAPAWSGKNHDQRQDLLQREGLNKPKKSTLLGTGSADLASAGAHDMFSKAIYDPAKACTVEGLVEACIPGRYTPRKLAAARNAAATAASGDDGPTPPTQVNSGLRRASSSPASLGIVFRVIPNSLGDHSNHDNHSAGRGGVCIAGIAPYKRLCGSRSTAILPSPENSAEGGACIPSSKSSSVRSSSPGGDSKWATGIGSEGDRDPGSIFAERLLSATGGSGRRRGGLSRSQSDFGRRGGVEWTHGIERAGSAARSEANFAQKSTLENGAQRGCPGSGPGSARMPRGQSPAKRRQNDQLVLDLAAVRSL